MTKFVRLTLALVLLITGLTATAPLPQVALATSSCPGAVEPAGSGTAADPYRIATPEHLMWLSESDDDWGASFIQVADIDFDGALAGCDDDEDNTGTGWSPIGSSTPFTGVYDGQGHSITGLFIARPDTARVGFFGRTSGAEIRHLHLIDVDITGSHEVGALIGRNIQSSGLTKVYDVSATGVVKAGKSGSGAADAGGLFGYVNRIDIAFARATVVVTAEGRNVGGLVGDGTTETSISRSWATGSVTSTGDQGQVGGLAGLFRGIGIYDSYATGDVTRGDVRRGVDEETSMPVLVGESGVGGLVGRLGSIDTELHRSYATGDVGGPACPDRCGFSVGDDADGRLPSKDVHLPTGSSETAIRLAAADWERTVIWSLPAAEGLPTLRTPPGRPVVTELTRDAGEVRVTVGSLDTTGFETNPLEVSNYQESNTVKRLHLEDNGFEDESDDAIEGSFAVELDPTSSGPTLLRVRARSGDVFGPAVSFWRPTAPRSLTADAITPDSIDLSWAAPADEGTATGVTVPPTTYVVEFGPSGTLAAQPETTATTTSLTGLDGATEYTARVSARNVIGVGAPSASITALTVPGAPMILAAGGLAAGNGEVRVLWEQPAGGSEITGYEVTASPGGATCTTTVPTRSCTVPGLTNGTEYTFSVTAENASGTGPASAVAGPITPTAILVTAPPAPTFTPGTPNQDPGAFEISGFDAEDVLLVSVGFVDPPAGTTFELTETTGLQGGFGYILDEEDPDFEGEFTQVSFTATQAAANAALAGLRVDTGAALGELSIRVTAIRNVEGVFYNPINDHFYEQFTTSVLAPAAVDSAASRARFGVPGYLATVTDQQEQEFVHENVAASNLWLGGSDDFRMLNRIGATGSPFANQGAAEGRWFWITGPETGQQFWSGAASGAPVEDAEGEDRYSNWCSGEPNDAGSPSEEFLLDKWEGRECWNDWGMFDSGTQRYLVEYSPSWDQTVTAASSGSPWGEIGAYVGVASATLTALVDRAPRSVVVTPGDTELTVSWEAPATGTVTGYEVTAAPASGTDGTCSTAPGTTTCTITGLANGTSYAVTVTAEFDSGPPATSLTAQATPIPEPPSGIIATPWNGQIRVDWTASGSTGVTGYRVERRTSGTDWTTAIEVAGSATSAVVPNLINGTAYEVRVRALAGGEDARAAGPASTVATATPFAFETVTTGPEGLGLVRLNLNSDDELLPEDQSLATFTQRRQLTRTGTAPEFTMSFAGVGPDGVGAYSYVTDVGYSGSAQLREGDERRVFGNSNQTGDPTFTHDMNASTPSDVGVRSNVLRLQSTGWCASDPGNTFTSPAGTATAGQNLTTYCSVFGPEAWSPPFSATADDGISFDIAARLVNDDYEYYAYLVEVNPIDDPSGKSPGAPGWVPTYDYGGGKTGESTNPVTTHTILAYGRGGRLPWTTVVGDIPGSGVYRFRFVNGSYDRTGGRLLGSQFFIDPASVKVGKLQTISFGALSGGSAADLVGVSTPAALTNASSTSGLPIAFASMTPDVCTVAADGSSLEVLSFGTCTITANQSGGDAGGDFWAPASTVSRTFTVTPVAQTLTVPALGPFDLFDASDFVATASSSAELALSLTRASLSSTVCSRESIEASAELTTAVFTLLGAGTCTVEATQSGTGIFSSRSTSRSVTVHDTRLSSLTVSSGTLTPALSPGVTDYAVVVPTGVTSLTLDVTPSASGATVSSTGLTPTGSSFTVPLASGGRTVDFVVTQGGATRTFRISIIRPAPPAPAAPPVVAPPLPPGPVVTAGAPPRPSPAPTARVGEREVTVVPTPAGTTRTEGTTTVSSATILEVGTIALALDVTGAGEVRTVAGTAPQVTVVRDRVARTSGGGMLPNTQVQAWLPLSGGDARPVVTLPVAEDGTFTGELPFDGRSDRETDGRPLPIGTHVLQLVGVDAAGEIAVIEQTVRIAQPDPAPEPDRSAGAPPTLTPGASIATNAGVPEAVTVVPVPEVRQARVEGSGWTMAVDIPSADGRVAPAEGGGALIELVEEDVAQVSGDGFLPGTRADVWLFSTPTLLGTVTIGPDGTFSGEVPVEGIETGEHTLQLQGVGTDGYVRAANLGVAVIPRGVDEPAAAPEPEPDPTPEPEPAEPDGTVEVVTAAGQDPAGTSPFVWLALIAALGAAGWWFLIGRRRRDDEAHQG